MSASGSQLPVIVNSVLSYVYVRMKASNDQESEDVCQVLIRTFDKDEFKTATEVLWNAFHGNKDMEQILGEKPKRRDSTARTAVQADCEDLLKAFRVLESANAVPKLAVEIEDLMELPPIMPQIVQHSRLSKLEDLKTQVQESQNETKTIMTSLKDSQEKLNEELSHLRKRLDNTCVSRVKKLTPVLSMPFHRCLGLLLGPNTVFRREMLLGKRLSRLDGKGKWSKAQNQT